MLKCDFIQVTEEGKWVQTNYADKIQSSLSQWLSRKTSISLQSKLHIYGWLEPKGNEVHISVISNQWGFAQNEA